MAPQPPHPEGQPDGGQSAIRRRSEPEVERAAGPSWPTVIGEARWWEPSEELPTRRRQRTRGEYHSAVVASISQATPPIPSELAATADEATIALARFDAEAIRTLQGAELGPIQSILLRSESAASSQIEQITVGARQLAQAALGEQASSNATLVEANVRTMTAAVALGQHISTENILAMHSELLHGNRSADPGKWRAVPVWIGGSADGPRGAEFVPVHHDRVPGAIDDLVAFTKRHDIPALTHAAIAHAQFETIHPFNDGNGRVGRALMHAMLRRAEVTSLLTVPISAGLLSHQDEYVQALTRYRDGDLTPIVTVMSEAAIRACAEGRRLLVDLSEIRQQWRASDTSRSGSAARRLPDLLLGQPVVSVRYVQDQLGVTFKTAQDAISAYEDLGVLRSSVVGKLRNRVWYAHQVTDALDRFASRSGRRELL